MNQLDQHPTVLALRRRAAEAPADDGTPLDRDLLGKLCLDAGADDVGVIGIGRTELDEQRSDIERLFPAAKAVISFVCRMNPEPVRSPSRSVANLEFHATADQTNDVARRIVAALARLGVRAINPPMGFPMEMDRFPGKVWTLSLKPLAVAAGLGRMGVHRSVIHPRFGSFVLLGAVLIDRPVTAEDHPIAYNPCLNCNLCVAACPVGALSPDGRFNFASCITHNYREFMSGFTDWAEAVADARSAAGYRRRFSDGQTASMWQSLSFGANYKAAYCLSVCPAGEQVIGPFLTDRPGFIDSIVRPLQQKPETVYVLRRSDAEDHVVRRFPHKRAQRVGHVLRPATIDGFIAAARHVFQPGRAGDLDAVYHFRFTGDEPATCTFTIRAGRIDVQTGLVGRCDLRVTADSRAWLALLRKEASILWLLLTLRIRLRGKARLLARFGRCFP